jgi:hypothetical protein
MALIASWLLLVSAQVAGHTQHVLVLYANDRLLPALTPTTLHLDWRQVRRWGIDPDGVPVSRERLRGGSGVSRHTPRCAGRQGRPPVSRMSDAPLIHVVDDDESLRIALVRFLGAAGFEACGYGSAGELLITGAAGQARLPPARCPVAGTVRPRPTGGLTAPWCVLLPIVSF